MRRLPQELPERLDPIDPAPADKRAVVCAQAQSGSGFPRGSDHGYRLCPERDHAGGVGFHAFLAGNTHRDNQLLCELLHHFPGCDDLAGSPFGIGLLRRGASYNKASFVVNFTRFGYAIIALDLAAHIAHNLFHMLAEGKSILYTGLALFGVDSQGASTALISTPTIQIMQFGLIGLGFIGSLYIVYRIAKANHEGHVVWATFTPYAVLMGGLGILNIMLFTLPMSMRM